jgi:hypothetical protein
LDDEDRAEVYNRILMKLTLLSEQMLPSRQDDREWKITVEIVGYLSSSGIVWTKQPRLIGESGAAD